jgi:nucleotide-binding universal stress UspA family protein
MMQFRRILVPIDFSDASRHALQHAITIAGWYDAGITAMHVRTQPLLVNPPIILAAARESIAGLTEAQQVEADLREWVAPATTAGLTVDTIVTEGSPATRILDLARALPADLVVTGTHGRSGVARLILGSVAERVLREAPCPVMTVPPAVAGASKLPFEHLLCPIDFSRSSLEGLRIALSLAQEAGARLTLLGVFDWTGVSGKQAADTPEFRVRWEAETRRELNALVPEDARNWCRVDTAIAFGRCSDEILMEAAASRVDLVVMGVQGRSAIDIALFGSTTNAVVRQAGCPVLTVRAA